MRVKELVVALVAVVVASGSVAAQPVSCQNIAEAAVAHQMFAMGERYMAGQYANSATDTQYEIDNPQYPIDTETLNQMQEDVAYYNAQSSQFNSWAAENERTAGEYWDMWDALSCQ